MQAIADAGRRPADRRSAGADNFWAEHGASVGALADRGLSKSQILERFALLFPELEQASIAAALDRSDIAFSKSYDVRHFPDAVLELGVWYVLGVDLGLVPDRGAALASIDVDEASELHEALGDRGFSSDQIAEILAVATGARELAGTTELSLSKKRYSELRIAAVSAQADSRQRYPWPADAQTVMRRLGNLYWTDAMIEIGLVASEGGRSKGLLHFTDSSYPSALGKYVADRRAAGAGASYDDYDVWRRREYRDGRTWPSGMAIRNRFGSWASAMRFIGGEAIASTSAAAGATSATSLGARTLHAVREEMDRRLEVISSIDRTADRDAEVREFLRTYAGNFEFDRREWLRAMIVLDPGAVSRRLSGTGLNTRQRNALSSSPPNVGAVLTDRYLDNVLSTGGVSNSDGWLAPAVQAELDAIPPLTSALYEVLRATRNLATHVSNESSFRVREALDAAGALDRDFEYQRSIRERNIIQWLSANDQARLRRLAEVMPDIWRAMTTAEAVLRATCDDGGALLL